LFQSEVSEGSQPGVAAQPDVALLHESRQRIAENRERRHLADIHALAAHLHILRGELPAARAALVEAVDLFERLGMRRDLAEARTELAQLEATIAREAAPALA
jgi:hypothetical protein